MPPNILAVFQIANDYLYLGFQVLIGLAVTILVATIVKKALKKSLSRISKNIKVDETQFLVFRRIVVTLVYVIGITITLSTIPGLSNVWLSVLTGAGVLAVVIGFAAQKTVGNIISGLFIAMFRPFRVGDRITLKGEHGVVEDITLVHTIVLTVDNRRLVIPNSVVSDEPVVNFSAKEEDVSKAIDIGISYDSDIDKAKKIMLEEALKHPGISRSIKKTEFLEKGEKAIVRVTEFKDSAINLQLHFWSKDYQTALNTGFELLESIKKRFDREGIEIPYPYRTIVYKKDLAKRK